MNYTLSVLMAAGLAGVLLHNLVKMNDLNRQQNGNFNYKQYFAIEKFSIIISVIVVGVCSYFSQEVKELANAGKWLGLGMVGLGYLAQSLLIKFMGNAQKKIESQWKGVADNIDTSHLNKN